MRGTASPSGSLAGTITALLLAGLLAGCADAPGSPSSPAEGAQGNGDGLVAEDGRDLRTELTADDVLPAPAWKVGDQWGMHFYFGSEGGEGLHVNAIVTEAGQAGYFVATDDQQGAKEQALDAFPILGPISNDLTMKPATGSWAGTWDWFHFPLRDGATWAGEIPNIAFDTLPEGQVPVQFTATYNDAIDVAGETHPGYDVEGLTEDGTPIIHYSYAPMAGWITSATVYDIDPEQDPIEFRIVLMDYSRNWTGTYYVAEANLLLHNLDGAGLSDLPPDGEPFVEPSPHATFTVSDEATYLYGYVANAAFAGARATILYTPNGEAREYPAVGAPEEGIGVRIDEPAMAGEWRLATAGAGAFTFSEVMLAEIFEVTGTL